MLDIVIVGAGIAGLAAGISLRRAGHKVCIYERSATDNEVSVAVSVPPNVSRFLTRWGLDPQGSGFVKAGPVHFQDPVTLETTSTLSHASNEDHYDADLWYAHRVGLRDALKKMATDAEGPGIPVTIHFNSSVVEYSTEPPAITFATGEKVQADLIVGADGIHSIACETVIGRKNPPVPSSPYNCCYQFLILAEVLEEDPETRFWNENADGLARLFSHTETSKRLVSYPCRNNTTHNIFGICYDEEMKSATPEDYNANVDKAKFIEKFEGFHPKLLNVINKATEIKRWPILCSAPAPTWRRGNMVLVGDAAHPMLPYQEQGDAMGIEDGVALGVVMSGVSNPSEVEKRLEQYERIRRDRTRAVQILSNVDQDQYHLVEEELLQFLPTENIPRDPQESIIFHFDYDVADEAVRIMEDFDPSFQLPHNFFDDNSFYMLQVNEELSKIGGFIKVETEISVESEPVGA
ncbi:3-hydroxybenzoate 6-hydroxylase 3 [Colletotrichum chlorophyti]|uniref:3-hydroxybenzoate 6-hydroxylase 3 n=1 Tax=Colletotrichum chlorophyti TaxID=708187 RepID=A0A1Q8S5Y5_9PEZI|nr:3-hydroxybenzoate 6-hydroxylase 3 [Colletotrichum chlorophyti]